MPSQPKTTEQLRVIFGLGNGRGLDKDALTQILIDRTGGKVERLSLMSFDQANEMIKHLGGDPIGSASGVPTRTKNYHRQKAGVVQLVTVQQLSKIGQLAKQRNMSTEGLESLCMKVIKKKRPTTTKEANKVTEALKAMIARGTTPRRAA